MPLWTTETTSYVAPLLTIAYFYGARLHSGIKLQKASPTHPTRRRAVLIALGAVLACFAVDLVLQIRHGIQGEAPLQHQVVNCVAYILTYGAIFMPCSNQDIQWQHLLGTHALALSLHLAISNRIAEYARSALLAVCCLQSTYYYFKPLDLTVPKPASVAETDEDDEDPFEEDYKDIKELQQKRLEQSGDWLSFIRPYKIFVPLILPVGNLKLQLCIAFLIIHLLVSRLFGILVPRQMGIIADKLAAGVSKDDFPWFDIVIWAGFSVCESELFGPLRDIAFTPVQQHARTSISSLAFRHIMNLSMDFHNDKSSSDLIRAVEQGSGIAELLSFICFELAPLLADVAIAVVYVSSSFDPYMALIMITGAVLYSWLGMETIKWSAKCRRRNNQALMEHWNSQYEGLSNWQTVTQFNRNNYESDRYDEKLEKYNKVSGEYERTYNAINTLKSSVLTIARVAATALAMYRVSQGVIPLGQLVTFTVVWSTIMNPLTNITYTVSRVGTMLTDSERLLLLLQAKPSVTTKPGAPALNLKAGKVEFKNVDFAYDPRKATISDVSFTAKAGSTVALVGQTGGGKSTLMKLLYRYYDITGGSIEIDGQDIRDVTVDSLRDIFGLVPQDPALFNSSIMENMRYAKLDATEEEIMDACRAACIHDKIMQFPDKYKSKVGEKGVKLSGGELQRIAIARAILRDPKIVLLDEATSMIDAETEAEIQKALGRLTAGRTTFVIAHRLSTIQHADMILVIEDGKVLEAGNHEQLFQKRGKYMSLWSKQLSKTINLLPSGTSTPMTSNDEDSSSETELDTRRKL